MKTIGKIWTFGVAKALPVGWLPRLFVYLAVILLLQDSVNLHAQENLPRVWDCLPTVSLDPTHLAFVGGERLSMNINYKWGVVNGTVCKATFSCDSTVFNGTPAYVCTLYGKTSKFYDSFFKVREEFKTWMSVDGLVPLHATRQANEGAYSMHNDHYFDYATGNAAVHGTIESSVSGLQDVSIPIRGCTGDLISAIYAVRNLDFGRAVVGQAYPMACVMDKDLIENSIVVLGREDVNVKGLGKVPAYKCSMRMGSGGQMFGGEGGAFIWFSIDPNHLPLKFSVPIRVGQVTGYLSSWEGLKYPFDLSADQVQ